MNWTSSFSLFGKGKLLSNLNERKALYLHYCESEANEMSKTWEKFLMTSYCVPWGWSHLSHLFKDLMGREEQDEGAVLRSLCIFLLSQQKECIEIRVGNQYPFSSRVQSTVRVYVLWTVEISREITGCGWNRDAFITLKMRSVRPDIVRFFSLFGYRTSLWVSFSQTNRERSSISHWNSLFSWFFASS